MTTRVVFLDRCTFAPSVPLHQPTTPHTWEVYERTSPAQVIERLQGAHVAITNKVPLSAETFQALPDLKMVSVAATGYDVIDIKAAHAHGVVVSNVRGYAIHTVPNHTFALMLALQRSIAPYRDSVKAGRWQEADSFCYFDYPIRDLYGARLGIMGEGVIGQAVARIATAFGMEPMFAAHKGVSGLGPLYTPFEQVLRTADVITVHAPLTAHTRHMIGAPEFAMMERCPLIINTARGGLVDERALVDALHAKQIRGFGFDVLTSEPPKPNNPLLEVLDDPRVIVTPHVAWASEAAQAEVWRQVIVAVDGFLAGRPTNVIT